MICITTSKPWDFLRNQVLIFLTSYFHEDFDTQLVHSIPRYQGFVYTFRKQNSGFICDVIYIDGCHRFHEMLHDIILKGQQIMKAYYLMTLKIRRLKEQQTKLLPMIECIRGEVLFDTRFAFPGWIKDAPPGKIFCQTKFNFS